MTRSLAAITTLVAISSAALLSLALSPSAASRPVGPLAVVHMHEQLFEAIDAGDAEAARALLHEDMHMNDRWRRRPCTLALHDVDGTSGLAVGHVASRGLLEAWTAAGAGARTRITSWVSDCRAEDLSYATLELERTHGEGEAQVTNRFIATSLVAYADGGWRITHMQIAPAGEKRPGSLALESPVPGGRKGEQR